MNDALDAALAWQDGGQAVALATVVETWGSAPRPAGSLMACNAAGTFVGSVSGGCVEVAVIEAARELMSGAPPRVLEFGVTDDEAWAVGLACGGRIRVLVEVPPPGLLQRLAAARSQGLPVVLASALGSGARRLLGPSFEPAASALDDAAAAALRFDAAQRVTLDDEEWLLSPINPPLRLIVVGAVHIAEALCAIARLSGHAVTLVDPRSAFLRPALFPGVALEGDWPQTVLPRLGLDARCAAVLLSHDPKIDDPALHLLLRSPAYYIGALGSRRTHARRLERLCAAGHGAEALARIRGPAGLAIGARTPAEIAIAVMAELTAALRVVGPH
jgi:xanthine dehydrogenase accessory factor